MTDAAVLHDRLAHFLLERIVAGDDGKALLLGLDAGRPLFAAAAGLRGEHDHPGFVTFARYLLHRRFACDGHALLLPAVVDGEPVYLMETRVDGVRRVQLVRGRGEREAWHSDEPLIGDLGITEPALPGIQRRGLDALFEQLRLPLPTSVMPSGAR